MPKARRKNDRLQQIYRWLKDNFQTPYPTKLHLRGGTGKVKHLGYVEQDGRKLNIHIDTRQPLYVAIDSLMHEFAHAMSWRHRSMDSSVSVHSGEWGLAYAKVYRSYIDEGGIKESWNY